MTDANSVSSETSTATRDSLAFPTRSIPTDQPPLEYQFLDFTAAVEEGASEDVYICFSQHDEHDTPNPAYFQGWPESAARFYGILLRPGIAYGAVPHSDVHHLHQLYFRSLFDSETASPHIRRIPLEGFALADPREVSGELSEPDQAAGGTSRVSASAQVGEHSEAAPLGVGTPTAEENAAVDQSKVATDSARSHWINRLLIISSIVAAIGVALIYLGDQANIPMVILAGLLMFASAAVSWFVPLVALSFWLFRDVKTYLSNRSARR